MNRIEHLTNLHRRVSCARELSDALLLEVLETCSAVPFKQLEKKYQLTELCHTAAWEQAALWIIVRSLPSWTLLLNFTVEKTNVKLLSAHQPPFTIEVSGVHAAQAMLICLVQTIIVLTRLGLDLQPR